MTMSEGVRHRWDLDGPWWMATRADELPAGLDWLSSEEQRHLSRLQVEKRRSDWLLGRWTAKSALRAGPFSVGSDADPTDLTVRQAADGAPEALWRGQPLPLELSISHRSGWGLCALAREAMLVGCDLEVVEARSNAFVEDYFTIGEQAALRAVPAVGRDRSVTALWAAKESVLKALRIGLRADTRRIQANLPGSHGCGEEWCRMAVEDLESDLPFGGWSRMLGTLMMVLVTSPASGEPIALSRES